MHVRGAIRGEARRRFIKNGRPGRVPLVPRGWPCLGGLVGGVSRRREADAEAALPYRAVRPTVAAVSVRLYSCAMFPDYLLTKVPGAVGGLPC